MNLDLDDEERAALVALLKHTIENDRYPMSPRLRSHRRPAARAAAVTWRPHRPRRDGDRGDGNQAAAMNLDLDEEENAALVALMKQTIENDRYPMSPRLQPLRSMLAKLETGTSKPTVASKLHR